MFGQGNQPNLFGGQKPTGFGSSSFGGGSFGNTMGNNMGNTMNTFGSANTNTFGQQSTGFGATNQFGQGNQATSQTANNGTGNPAWQFTVEREGATAIQTTVHFQSITAMPAYKNWSFEELRLQDYQTNKKFASAASTTTTGFGATTTGFGQPAQPTTGFGATATTNTFGQPATSTFGQPAQTSTFGQPATTGFGGATASAFGQPAVTTGFGQPAQTTGFGTSTGFGQTTSAFGQPATGGFGQPAQPTSAFGQPAPTTSTFGQPAQTTSAFGQPATGGFGQPAQTTGFGQPAQTTSAFGQPAATGFGQPAQPSTGFGTGGGLFNKPATGGFGSTTTSFGQPAQPATGGFGQPAQTTSAFGQPAQTTSAFGQPVQTTNAFGQQNTTTATGFGQPATTGFGQPQQTTSAFGTAAPSLTTPTTGLFGQQNQTTGGLFGNNNSTFGKPAATGFGQPAPAANTGGLFGKPAAPTTSLFGQPAATTTTTNLFGQPAATTTTNSLFGNNTANTTSMFGKPQTTTTGFGTSLGLGQQQQPQQVLHASLDKNPYGINPLLTKSTNQPPLQPQQTPQKEKKLPTVVPSFKVTPRSSSQIKLRGVAPPSPAPALAESHKSQISGKLLDGSPRDVVALGLDNRFTPRRSVKRLTIDDASTLLQTPSKNEKSVTFDPVLEETASAIFKTPAKIASVTFASPKSPKKEYVMSPSLDVLLRMTDDELKRVERFTISIPVYGSVQWVDPVDLYSIGRTKIQELVGSIVVIQSQVVTVYPDDDDKPREGEGLNKPAIISLCGCWPKDKSTGAIIDNENDPRFDKHVKKLKNMPNTLFLGFEIVTGTWKFRVEHFSRYGLVDSDDEESGPSPNKDQDEPKKDQDDHVEDTFMKGGEWELVADASEASEDVSEEDSQEGSEEVSEEESEEGSEVSQESEQMVDTTASEDGSIASESQGNEESLATIQTLDSNDIGVSIGASVDPIEYIKTTRNVASMRASLFGPSPSKTTTKPIQTPVFEKRSGDAIQEVKNSRPLFSQFPAIGGNHTTKYQKQEEPKVLKKVDLSKPVDLNTSLVNNTKLFVDAAYFQGRSFRASFSNNGILIPNQFMVKKVSFSVQDDIDGFIDQIKAKTTVKEGKATIAQLSEQDLVFEGNRQTVWELVGCLFDPIPGPFHEAIRRERISKWLENRIKGQDLVSLFVKRQVGKVCEMLVERGDYHLAMCLSQVGSVTIVDGIVPNGVPGSMDIETMELLQTQMQERNGWSKEYQMLWGLVSGDVEEYVENCQDWYQALGVCMWFANGGISFKEAFEMLQTKHAKQNCIEYALMELYAKQKSVDQVLVGEDTRLLWTCGLYLNAEMDLLTSQMMMELEQSGQWQHALFVASFLENQREEQLIRILERWYPLDDASGSFINTETSQVFQFVKGLGIPEKWIHQSRVVSARYQNNTKQELISLMDCGDFVEAHKLLYRIVPRLLLLNRYETQVMQQVVELMQRNGWNCEWIQEIKKGQYEGHDLMTKRAVEMFKTRDVSGQSFKLLQQLV